MNAGGMSRALLTRMSNNGAKNYRALRVWDAAREVKQSLYDLVETPPFDGAERLREQLREAAASAVSQISEGYGRFEPGDHARYLKMARASLVECQNHLVDAMDRRLISDSVREEHEKRIQGVLNGIGGLIAYLQSPEAKRNVERIKQQRAARRARLSNDEP
jgi:four helix bundle protein